MPKVPVKVIPIVDKIRTLCRGKQRIDCLRYADTTAARTQPAPHVPGGPYHKTSKIYYYTRDVRRSVKPPTEIYTEGQIEAGKVEMIKK